MWADFLWAEMPKGKYCGYVEFMWTPKKHFLKGHLYASSITFVHNRPKVPQGCVFVYLCVRGHLTSVCP